MNQIHLGSLNSSQAAQLIQLVHVNNGHMNARNSLNGLVNGNVVGVPDYAHHNHHQYHQYSAIAAAAAAAGVGSQSAVSNPYESANTQEAVNNIKASLLDMTAQFSEEFLKSSASAAAIESIPININNSLLLSVANKTVQQQQQHSNPQSSQSQVSQQQQQQQQSILQQSHSVTSPNPASTNTESSPNSNSLEKRKQHNCPYCDRSFTRPYRLHDHISFSHTDERKYMCSVCSKNFSCKDKLKHHVDVKHEHKKLNFKSKSKSPSKGNSEPKSPSSKLNLACSYPGCTKMFANKYNVKRHVENVHLKMRRPKSNKKNTTGSNNSSTSSAMGDDTMATTSIAHNNNSSSSESFAPVQTNGVVLKTSPNGVPLAKSANHHGFQTTHKIEPPNLTSTPNSTHSKNSNHHNLHRVAKNTSASISGMNNDLAALCNQLNNNYANHHMSANHHHHHHPLNNNPNPVNLVAAAAAAANGIAGIGGLTLTTLGSLHQQHQQQQQQQQQLNTTNNQNQTPNYHQHHNGHINLSHQHDLNPALIAFGGNNLAQTGSINNHQSYSSQQIMYQSVNQSNSAGQSQVVKSNKQSNGNKQGFSRVKAAEQLVNSLMVKGESAGANPTTTTAEILNYAVAAAELEQQAAAVAAAAAAAALNNSSENYALRAAAAQFQQNHIAAGAGIANHSIGSQQAHLSGNDPPSSNTLVEDEKDCKIYTCARCPEIFNSSALLRKHVSESHEKGFHLYNIW